MSDLSLNSVSFHASQPVQQTAPKSPSDPKPANTPNTPSSRGPAVVLSGAFSQASGGASGQNSTQNKATGQHINHVF